MSDSVGKISLDIDLRSDLNKQINHIAGNIGTQLSKTLQQHVSGTMNGMKGLMPKFGMPKKTFQMPKKTYSTSNVDTEGAKGLDSVLSNTNAKIDIQKKKLADLKAQYAAGMSDKVKSQIEQLERVMQSSEGRIQALNSKLKDLKYSYDNAVSPERKNKLLDQISKTEMQMSSLINKSDKANQSIIELESGFSQSKKNALLEKIVNTEASLLRLNKSADATKSKMAQLDGSMDSAGKGAGRAEKPVRRLGNVMNKTGKAAHKSSGAFSLFGGRANNMATAFSHALTRMLRQVFIFAILYKALHSLTSYMGSALKTNQQFMHSLGQIRTNLQVAFMPIYQAILPALNALASALATVTAYIASFVSAIFGKTYKQSFQAAQGLNAARAAMEGYGSAAKKAAKDTLGLAAFDEVNTLAFNKDDDTGAGGGGADSKIAPLIAPDIDTGLLDTKMAELVGSVKKLLEPTISSLKNLWKAMDPFKAFAAKGAVDFYEHFLKPIGKWTFGEGLPRFLDILADGFRAVDWPAMNDALNGLWKVLTPFTVNVGKGLLWFLEYVLKPIGVWTMNEAVPRFLKILSNAIDIVNVAIEAFKPTGKWIYDEFLKPLAKWTGGIIIKILDEIKNGLDKLSNWIKEHQELFQNIILVLGSFALAWGIVGAAIKLWSGISAIIEGFGAALAFLISPIGLTILAIGALIAVGVLLYKNWDKVNEKTKEVWSSLYDEIIKPAVDLIVQIIKDMIEIVLGWWDTWGKKLLEGIKDALKNIGLLFVNLWENLLQPLIKNMLETMTRLWNNHLKGLIKDIGDFVGKLVTAALEIFHKFIMPVVNYLIKTLGPVFVSTFKDVLKIVEWAVGLISDVIKGLLKSLGGLIDFIAGVFTGDWKRAWEGIKNFMKGIGDGLVAIFKGSINLIIDAFNFMIKKLNKLKIDIPDWVPLYGGETFGFTIPTIPKLAKGGIVDQPTLAMVGEAGRKNLRHREEIHGKIKSVNSVKTKFNKWHNSLFDGIMIA